MKYIATTKENVKSLNTKQTVIIETVTTTDEKGKSKSVKNVYVGNFKRRRDAFYIGMEGMKTIRKGETTKSYRLLKLDKLIAEVSVKGYNTKTNYLISETYNEEEKVIWTKPEAETTEEVIAEAAPEQAEIEFEEKDETAEEVDEDELEPVVMVNG